jgi:hypothetical protein
MAAKSISYYQTGPCQEVKQKEHLFHLYMYQHVEGKPGANQLGIVNPGHFGTTAVIDWIVRDGLAPDANIVARAQGLGIQANMTGETWLMCYTMLFSDERFVIVILFFPLYTGVSISYVFSLNPNEYIVSRYPLILSFIACVFHVEL